MAWAMSINRLLRENRRYRGSGGVSGNNRDRGFVPAFLDSETGIVHIARNPDGTVAACHRLDGLADTLVLERGADGRVTAVKPTLVAGFERGGTFYTREQAARFVAAG